MSKRLVKIISLCALAIILPLVIVGAALIATEAKACVLSIYEGGINGQYASSDISIRVDGKELDGDSAKIQKNSEVTVVFTGEGYDFKGWFNGKADEIKDGDSAKSQDMSYTFTLRENTTLTAVRDVKKYNITYAGFLSDGTTSVSTVIAETTQVVEYGYALESLQNGDSAEFLGWYVAQEEGEATDATPTMVANFDEKEVTLNPAFANQIIITFMKGDTSLGTARLNESDVASYVLPNENSDFVKNNLKTGYKFAGWYDSQVGGDKVETLNTSPEKIEGYKTNGLTLYMQETLINYTLNVKYHAVNEDASKNTTIDFDVENGFEAYSLKDTRYYYSFKGFEYNEVLYEITDTDYISGTTSLRNIITAQSNNVIDVIAVWECEFTSYIFNFKAYCEYQREGTPVIARWGVYDNNSSNIEENKLVEMMDKTVVFKDKSDSRYYDLEDNILGILLDSNAKYYTKEGNEVKFNGTVIVVDVNTNVEFAIHGIKDVYTFRNVMGRLEYQLGSVDNINQISVGFMFDIVA